MKTLEDFNFKDKKVLVRCDFNVPVIDGIVEDDFRIKSTITTIRFLVEEDAKVILMSHLENANGENLSLSPVKEKIEEYLGEKIFMANDCVGEEVKEKITKMANGQVLFLENLRFHEGEKKNDSEFAEQLAELGDIFVNDAFSVCHRAHASIVGIPKFLPSCAGLLLEKEISVLSGVLENPSKPLVAIIGGAKIATKARMIKNFLEKADYILLGGKVANVVLQMKGLYKDAGLDKEITPELDFDINSSKIILPFDFVKKGDFIFDIGKKSAEKFSEIISGAKTIVWSGPMGKFEEKEYEEGTNMITTAVQESSAYKIIGGGDTISAVSEFGNLDKFNHVSTGGGAMLEFLGGKKLPGIEALK